MFLHQSLCVGQLALAAMSLKYPTMLPVVSSQSKMAVCVLAHQPVFKAPLCVPPADRNEIKIRNRLNPLTVINILGSMSCDLTETLCEGQNGGRTFEGQKERNCSQHEDRSEGEREDRDVDLKGERG